MQAQVYQKLTQQLIFHPSTGLCVLRRSVFEPLTLGPCTHPEASWNTRENYIP